MKRVCKSCQLEAELGPPSLGLGYRAILMNDPDATFRPYICAVFSESPYVIISVLSISDQKAFMLKFGRKNDSQNWCGWEGEECPQQGGQTMEIVGFESQELNQGNFSIQLFLFFYYQHNMLPHVFFFLFVSDSSASHSQAAFLKIRNRILSPSLVTFQRG